MSDREGELTLAIETSNPSSGGVPGVALGRVDGDAVALIGVERLGEGERHDDLLMPAIRSLMQREGFEPGQLERVVCSIGPGGYTGLRIATAAANMISLTSGARLYGVPSAWVAARESSPAGAFAVALSSKKDTSYVTVFPAGGGEPIEGRVIAAAELEGLGIGVLLGDRFLPTPFREACDKLGIEVREPAFSAEACLMLAPRLRAIPVGQLVPEYGREAEAVTKWRELHPKPGRS